MLYRYNGLRGCDSKCDIEIKGNIVIAKELEDNHGTSITNWAENLANEISEKFGIDKAEMIWVECYEQLGEYAIVKFELKDGELCHPTWEHCSKGVIDGMLAKC